MKSDDRRNWRGGVALAVGLVGLVLIASNSQYGRADAVDQVKVVTQQRDQSEADAKKIAAEAIAICARGGPAAVEMGQLCRNAVAVAQKPPPVPQADSLTESRARQLVREELVSNNLVLSPTVSDQLARVTAGYVRPVPGPTGPPGKAGSPGPAGPTGAPGASITDDEARGLVRAALATVCGDDGAKCRGTDGKDAAPVTDEQRASDLTAYCSRDEAPCRGPSPFPFTFVFRIDDRQITCRIQYAGDGSQPCETVAISTPSPSTGG